MNCHTIRNLKALNNPHGRNFDSNHSTQNWEISCILTIIHLPRQPKGVLVPDPSLAERGKLMSTYEEFMILLTFAGLIVSILNLKNK